MNTGAGLHSPYRAWPSVPNRNPGYTLLLCTPADLPVFFNIAMRVIARQDLKNCYEVLVVPDQFQANFSEIFASERIDIGQRVNLRLHQLGAVDALIAQSAQGHSVIHCFQLIRGIGETKSTHAILHDVDAFLLKPDFFERLYDCCTSSNYACLGVDHVWNIKDLAKHGYKHINATWELTVDVEWMQQWPPASIFGKTVSLNGDQILADSLVALQMETPPERLGKIDVPDSFIHFSHVISAYREFQRTPHFLDEYFRVFLIRLLIDAFDQENSSYDVPSVLQLARGISSENERVVYVSPDARSHYKYFRKRLEKLMICGLLSDTQISGMRSGVEVFDQAFSWRQKVVT
ncbi:MAG TPA: hypothetical protein V6C69_07490 [Trichormus sp.]|jgi:hypothetical protein